MITEIQRTLLQILASSLFGAPKPDMQGTEWTELLHEAKLQAVFPLAFSTVQEEAQEALLPGKYDKHDRKFQQYIAEALKNFYYHGELHILLTNNNIPYVAIKGPASAKYYPDPMLRTAGDIDFLVKEEDLERAKKALEKEGYKEQPDPEHGCHVVFHREDEILEMHWEPNGIPEGEKGDLCREYMEDCLATASLSDDEEPFLIPDAFHHGLIILLHTVTHLINTGIGLRHLCDWAVFVSRTDEKVFTKLFREKLKNVGLWQFAKLLTAVSTEYLGLPVQSWAMDSADKEFLEKMMEDIVSGGNFGSKDPERINDAKLVTTNGRMQGSMLAQLFASLTRKAKIALPACNKIPLLLPVGWTYVSIRHLIRVRHGSRPQMHVRKMMHEASERREIYQRFELFE